jgi:hypothetical protein
MKHPETKKYFSGFLFGDQDAKNSPSMHGSIWRMPVGSTDRRQELGKATPAKRLAKWKVEPRPVDKSVLPVHRRSQKHAAPSTG